MEKRGEKVIKISHSDDKRQITGVFAATLAGDYFPPQLIYKGKTCIGATLNYHFHKAEMFGIQKIDGQMKRQ